MKNYIYDNTFEGLLTAIYEAFYRREKQLSILNDLPLQNSMIDDNEIINTDSEKALKVFNSIIDKIGKPSLEILYNAFLTEHSEKATWIYEYLRLGFKTGPNIDHNLSDDRVFRIHKLSAKVSKETHLLIGLLRFKQLSENLYYASIEPDNNILELLAPHFADRMADQNFIIHDIKRGYGVMYNQKEWVITEIKDANIEGFGQEELKIQNLWKQYFKNIAITSRINPKLQKRIMPVRYWKHLIEKNNH